MANNNDEGSAAAMAGVGLIVMMMVLFAVFAFISAIMTVVALFALICPIRLGKIRVSRAEAFWFLAGGLIGGAMVPAFVHFTELLFEITVNWEFWLRYMLVGGYTTGSLTGYVCIEYPDDEPTPPPPLPQVQQRTAFSIMPPPSERFARWDDEEMRK